MAHFAELDANGVVLRVVVIDNKDIKDEAGVEQEERGRLFCEALFNGGRWVQTSYNASFRKNAAFIGCRFDPELDAFIHPKPYPSWVLDANCRWQAPIPYPQDGASYGWDEATLSWVKTEVTE